MSTVKNALVLVALLLLTSCTPLSWQPHGEAESSGYPTETSGSYIPGGTGMSAVEENDPYSAESYRLVSRGDEIVAVLKNGLTVIARQTASPVVSVTGYVRTGSIYEGKYLGGGLSHLLEHLVAGGSCQRRSEAENRNLLQQIGGNSNAFTTFDHTVFFVNTTTDHMAQAVDLVTGWLYGARITRAEYKREYQVVQRELEKDKGEADWVFDELTRDTRYQMSPARIPVVGYQAVIQGLSRDDVYGYYKSAYVPENIVFCVVGNAAPEDMIEAVRKYSVGVEPGRVPQKVTADEPPVQAPRMLAGTFPNLGAVKLELAFPSVRMTDADMYAMDLLSAVLGQGDSSMLVQELRDEKHLVSTVSAGDDTPPYVAGTFEIDMEVAPDKIQAVRTAVLADVEHVKHDPIPADRIARAKTLLEAGVAMSQQTSEQLAQSLADNFVTTGTPDDTYAQHIAQVTSEQLTAVANKYLDTGTLLTTALFPSEMQGGLAGAENLLRRASATTAPSSQPFAAPTMAGATPEAASPVQRTELPNGTILLIKRMPSASITSIQLYSLGGLTAEDAKTNGLGNLAMNAAVRGAKDRSATEIETFFDSIGGTMQTDVSSNFWMWQATTLKDDWTKALPVFADIVTAPTFADADVAATKERLKSQVAERDRDWYPGGYEYFRKCFFGASNSPYQFSVSGSTDNVASFTPQQVRDFYKDKILTGHRVLAIYGDVDVNKAQALATQYLGGGAKVAPAPSDPVGAAKQFIAAQFGQTPAEGKPSIHVQDVKVQKWDNPQCAVFIGFKSDSVTGDPDDGSLIMAQTLTGGYTYPTGYIFETLRGLGLVYDAHSINFPGMGPKYPGAFWVYAVCDPKNANKVIDEILENMARLQGSDKDIDVGWFNRAKSMIVTSDAMDRETPQDDAQTAAVDEGLGLGYAWHDQFATRIQNVRLSDVQALAHRRLLDAVVTVSTQNPDAITIKTGVRTYDKFEPVDLTPKGIQHDTGASNGK